VNEIPLLFRNLDRTLDQASYSYRIFNQNGQIVDEIASATNANIYPFHSHGFNFNSDNPNFANPLLTYRFPNIANPETYTIQHVLKRSGRQDDCATNDTMEQTVHFGNYYAYDDGTPEMSFGFVGDYVITAQFAYKFPLAFSDTLGAIQIWFNHTLNEENMSRAYLNLAVWTASGDSIPLLQVYVGESFSPTYNETIGYKTYFLDEPVVLQKGTFFIGFQQQSDAFLNIGFDQNNHAENSMFYHNIIHNEWLPILQYGSVMMRPVFGTTTPTGFCERGVDLEKILVYPNPSDGLIFVESPENIVTGYEIYDLTGRRLLQKTGRDTHFSIPLPEKTGTYILLLNTEKGLVSKKVVRR
jgi:hypothetical protein